MPLAGSETTYAAVGRKSAHANVCLATLAPTWPRELKAMDGLAGDVNEYVAITCPTLLLLGTESAEHPFRHAISALSQTLPDVRIASLAGQSHMAMRSAQSLLAQQISGFVAG